MLRHLVLSLFLLNTAATCQVVMAQNTQAHNPVIYADVPDMSIIRVGNKYYMSSTTMHMSPGVPIMESTDLVNWKMISYAYQTLDTINSLSLKNGESTYGRGSWASCLRYHKGMYYVSTFAQPTGRTHIYKTKDIAKGPWVEHTFAPSFHDHTLFFDDDGKTYLIYGAGKLKLVELEDDLSGVKKGTEEKVIIENAALPAGNNIGLPAEGSQLFKIKGKYYLFNITWPRNSMRTVVVHRADKITGPYEGKMVLQDKGVAQGGLIDTPDGRWFAYLFQDCGSVGRIPFLVPVKWEDGWPVLGENGKVPEFLNLPANKSLIPGIVNSDEFNRKKGEPALPLVWQWNHNPDNNLWSVSERNGYLRLKTGRIDQSYTMARNTLTQRTVGPECSGSTCMDASNMKDGDCAGLSLLQKDFGWVGIRKEGNVKHLVMVNMNFADAPEVENIPLTQDKVYLKIDCDFKNRTDKAYFYYSLDGKQWTSIGKPLKMSYTIPHFMGYRYGLFNYATKEVGGFVDFDYFHIADKLSK